MNIYIKVFYISNILLLICFHAFGQIALDNPSFEGIPSDATMPNGWFSASNGTTPDILPGYWGVYNEAYDGQTYLGLITRPDASFESIQQRMDKPLKNKTCYKMGLMLAHSTSYAGYNKPLFLRIWISDKKSERQQLVFKSKLIEHYEWKPYNFSFTPEGDKYYIILEAYISDDPIPYEGNLLLDEISLIQFCNRA